MNKLDLDDLKQGFPGVSKTIGAYLSEAGMVCLLRSSHKPGTEMSMSGSITDACEVTWSDEMDDQIDRAWHDQFIATEHGAEGISVLTAVKNTEYTVIQRSARKTGFDYWLGKKGSENTLFQDKAKLEISGIFKGDDSEFERRQKEKTSQISKHNDGDLKLPAFVSVVEFSQPRNFFQKS